MKGHRACLLGFILPVFIVPVSALVMSGCGRDSMTVRSLIDEVVSIEVRAPDPDLRGGCDRPFRDRYCRDLYEFVGMVEIGAGEERELTLSDEVSQDRCTNLLWLRLVWLGGAGPVSDPGTLIQLPAEVEIERGPGVLHSVAFPQATVRLDEVGTLDGHQSRPPEACPTD